MHTIKFGVKLSSNISTHTGARSIYSSTSITMGLTRWRGNWTEIKGEGDALLHFVLYACMNLRVYVPPLRWSESDFFEENGR